MRPFVLLARPSRLALVLATLFAAAFAVAVVCYALPAWLLPAVLAAWLMVLASEGYLPWRRPVTGLRVDAAGDLYLLPGGEGPCAVSDASLASRYLTVLVCRAAHRRYRLVLWPDSTDPESLRRLRVHLRWQRPLLDGDPDAKA